MLPRPGDAYHVDAAALGPQVNRDGLPRIVRPDLGNEVLARPRVSEFLWESEIRPAGQRALLRGSIVKSRPLNLILSRRGEAIL